MFDKALFTYYISQNCQQIPSEFTNRARISSYTIAASLRTDLTSANGKACAVAIIGVSVDSFGQLLSTIEIAEYIADNVCSVNQFLAFEPRLAGKYVVLLCVQNSTYIIGDATGSVQINCYCQQNTSISSIAALLAAQNNIPLNDEKRSVRSASTDLSQPMPGWTTVYNEIYALLPNHYMCLESGAVTRFTAINKSEKYDSFDLIQNIVRQYYKKFSLICPLSGGKDSRVVFAFLRAVDPNIQCFTMHHKKMSTSHPDLIIPKEICGKLSQPYTVVDDVTADPDWISYFDNLYGKGMYSTNTVTLALTIQRHFAKNCIIDGGIIGQIGKASLHRSTPEWLMGPKYFTCKTHNFRGAPYTKEWYLDAKNDTISNIGDLYSLEIRMGRWGSQGGQIYDLMGLMDLNIFNNRYVISEWMNIPPKKRIEAEIHIRYLNKLDSNLLETAFESDPLALSRIAKSNAILFWLGSFCKYYINKREWRNRCGL